VVGTVRVFGRSPSLVSHNDTIHRPCDVIRFPIDSVIVEGLRHRGSIHMVIAAIDAVYLNAVIKVVGLEMTGVSSNPLYVDLIAADRHGNERGNTSRYRGDFDSCRDRAILHETRRIKGRTVAHIFVITFERHVLGRLEQVHYESSRGLLPRFGIVRQINPIHVLLSVVTIVTDDLGISESFSIGTAGGLFARFRGRLRFRLRLRLRITFPFALEATNLLRTAFVIMRVFQLLNGAGEW